MFLITTEPAQCLVSQEVTKSVSFWTACFSLSLHRAEIRVSGETDSCWGFWPLDSGLAAGCNHVASAVFLTTMATVKQQGKATSVEYEKSISSLSTLCEISLRLNLSVNHYFFINESPGVYVHRTANALNSVEFKWTYIEKRHILWHLIVSKVTSKL